MAKICIDPGHSGIPDPGAVGPKGLLEADVTLLVGLSMRDVLTEQGHQIMMTRVAHDPASDSLSYRCDIANQFVADIFVSIHCNASTSAAAHGTETYYFQGSSRGQRLAEAVQAAMVGLGRGDRGTKTANFYVLKYTDMPAVLVELAFISNPEEEELLGSTDFQQRAAAAIVYGIDEYFANAI
jgi:N-acetylmuramoyl-L-alanine amidase